MKRLFLVWSLLLISVTLSASHIVGGEFELLHINGFTYRLNMIIYFDEVNGLQGAKDQTALVRIFRKRDNAAMQDITMFLSGQLNVDYSQPACSKDFLVTSKLVYTATLALPAALYDDPDGYYVTYQRCCRNYTVTNIFSDFPNSPGSLAAGQTFYLEFPPVVKNNQQLINSTPRLFPPLSDYACPNKPYFADFAGIDDDGDSLVYSLVKPLSTNTFDAIPNGGPLPAPYREVTFRSPFSFENGNIMGGAPDLSITQDGLLRLTPTQQGLFVFAVKVEEFRDGVKLGETRRDFQLLVTDACESAEPPKIIAKKFNEATYTYSKNMSVSFPYTATDEERCIQVRVSDDDSLKDDLLNNFTEQITVKAIPLNFKGNVSGILPQVKKAKLENGSTFDFNVCFSSCPYVNRPFQIAIIAFDDACAQPLFDTLKITVNIQLPPNTDPYFISPAIVINETIDEGETKSWPINAVDDDGDPLNILIVTDGGFNLADFGMRLEVEKNGSDSEYKANLVWDTPCDVYDFTGRTEFNIKIFAEDVIVCKFNSPAIAEFNLKIKLPGNADPLIDTDLGQVAIVDGMKRITVERKINESLNFNLFGSDDDDDFIYFKLEGKNFSPTSLGTSFPLASGNGNISSQFNWDIRCSSLNLDVKDSYSFLFMVVDEDNKCGFYKVDTLEVIVKLLPPDNTPPVLQASNMNTETIFENQTVTAYIGQAITIAFNGFDEDEFPAKDNLHLRLVNVENGTPSGYVFDAVTGRGTVSSIFSWEFDCNIFPNNVYEASYTLTFELSDDRCFNSKSDIYELNIVLRDYEQDEIIIYPPNIFTPNGDGYNPYFAMEMVDPSSNETTHVLPPDNCRGRFEGIKIFNRWGKEVYSSSDRYFKWFGNNEAPGVYFYRIAYTHKEYKGTITLRD
jgi:hypothetical protein